MTTVISLSSPFADITAYVDQGGSTRTLPVFTDSVSTALSSQTICGLTVVVTQVQKPSTSSSTIWFAFSPSLNDVQRLTINPNSADYPVYTSLGTYQISV